MRSNDKINVLFLDYDGVINIDTTKFVSCLDNPEAIYFLNKLCLEEDFNIVVSSSWKKHPNYQEFLYDAGLDIEVKILGCTIDSNKGRAYEIKQYLDENENINLFLVLDDLDLSSEFDDNFIKTFSNIGFNREKYIESIEKINNLKNKNN